MVNGIYFDVYRDDESESTWSNFSSRRFDFPDEVPRSSVYSTINKRIRSWIRFPSQPGSGNWKPKGSYAPKASVPPKIVPTETPPSPLNEGSSIQGEVPVDSDASNALGPPEIPPFEDYAITLDELNKLTGDFGQMSLVAQGKYGQVFRATLSTGEAAAVKKLNPSSLKGSDSDFAAELSKISSLKHDNFVKLLGYCLEANNRILVHEFATMGSLGDILHGRKGIKGSEPGPVLTWNQRVKIAFGAAVGLGYVHNEVTFHGAISSSNILIFDGFVSKIADICLSNKDRYADTFSPKKSELHPYRLSPVLYEPSSPYLDVYRFGVVLLELLTGRKEVDCTMLQNNQNLVSWVTTVFRGGKVLGCIDPKLNTDYPPKGAARLAHIAALCVQYEPEFRPNMDTVVKCMHPLLKFSR